MNNESTSFFDRTLTRIRKAWSEFSSNLSGQQELRLPPDLPQAQRKKLIEAIDQSLQAHTGEVSARNIATRIGRSYMTFDQTGKEHFFRLLATHYDVQDEQVNQAISNYQQASPDKNLSKLRHQLRIALLAPRVNLLTLFNALPEGIKFLVDMRADIIALGAFSDPELSKVELDLKHLLRSWFDVGFLELRKITWDSPASLLEKLIEYEAVHEITSWQDLKNRLAEDRRLFAFFHPNMPKEPLIFIHVALVNGLANNVQALLDPDTEIQDIQKADTAIFYSISNAQQGLNGISFGNFLIKRVVSEVKKELPQLKQFSTLSPIPTFRKWLEGKLDSPNAFEFNEQKLDAIQTAATALSVSHNLKDILECPDWHKNTIVMDAIQPVMLHLCAIYLSTKHSKKQRLLDPVAHFHISNGAEVKQINWMGDISSKGFDQSYGMMINYLYKLDQIDQNSENYSQTHEVVLAKEVNQLLETNRK
jgi:malonyl-CoA decarboxylase